MELQTRVAGIQLEHPIMNSAGTCKSLEEVSELCRTATAAVMVGSITVEPRMGNAGDVYWTGPLFSLNSLGLPNRGLPYYQEVLPLMVAAAHQAKKSLFVSVAGFSPEEYVKLTWSVLNLGADLVELNLSCPNVWSGGSQKRIACFDSGIVREILWLVGERVGVEAPVAVKISPFSDPFALAEVAEVLGESPLVKVVTAVNTFANAFIYKSKGTPAITPGGGHAGLAGPALKPIGLGHVRQLRHLLPERIQVIGAGGVTYGSDVEEYLDCGAVAVQVGTAYQDRQGPVFASLLDQFVGVTEAEQ